MRPPAPRRRCAPPPFLLVLTPKLSWIPAGPGGTDREHSISLRRLLLSWRGQGFWWAKTANRRVYPTSGQPPHRERAGFPASADAAPAEKYWGEMDYAFLFAPLLH